MLRMLTAMNLPNEEEEFFELLRIFFPVIYDVKYLMKSCKNLKGGLQEVADQLELERIGKVLRFYVRKWINDDCLISEQASQWRE